MTRFLQPLRTGLWLGAVLVAAALGTAASARAASDTPQGSVSGLPIPRYVSLKTDRVNLREGPSKDHRTAWVFQRAGLPVEITAEFEVWRRIRDAGGTEAGCSIRSCRDGAPHSSCPGRRTPLSRSRSSTGRTTRGSVVAQLQPNVITSVKSCTGGWCRVSIAQPGRDISGFIRQDRLWGVYPNEKLE
jgi:SH3-like domain-containing protein